MLNGKNRKKIDWSQIHKNKLSLGIGSGWTVMGDFFIFQHAKFSTWTGISL